MSEVSDVPESRRLRKKERTRSQIKSAAARLFRDKGYENVTIADIANAADVDVTTFWRHFKSKSAILYADQDLWVAAFQAALQDAPPELSPVDAAIRSLTRPMQTVDPEFAQLRQETLLRNPTPEIRAAIFAIEETLELELTNGLARRMKLDPTKDPRPAVLSSAVIAAARWARENQLGKLVEMQNSVREKDLRNALRKVGLLMVPDPSEAKPPAAAKRPAARKG